MPSRFYDVLEFSQDNLCKGLSNEICLETDLVDWDSVEWKKVKYLYDYLSHKGISSKTIIVENYYVDGDYLDDYSNYYAKCFYPYKRICKRLHFFSEKYSEADFLSFIKNANSEEFILPFQNSYKGFVIARPLPRAVIGRTAVIHYPKNDDRDYPCIKDCKANLFGINLTLRSLEFQEQDKVMSACATVALWCCLHKTAELFQTSVPTPAMITGQASQIVDEYRSIPNNGLIVTQINKAILSNGLVAEINKLGKDVPILSLLYAYLKAEIPIILGVNIKGVGLHAITLVGYSFEDTEKQPAYKINEWIPFKANKLTKLYAHDDQIGPFSRVDINRKRNRQGLISLKSSWKNRDHILPMTPKLAIIPLYHKIRVTYFDIYELLNKLSVIFFEDEQLHSYIKQNHMDLCWDLYLTTTNHLKDFQLKNLPNDSEELRKLLIMAHPHYIWHAILYNGNTKLIELMADSTDIPKSFPFYYILWHDDTLRKKIIAALHNLDEEGILEYIISSKFIKFLREGPEKFYLEDDEVVKAKEAEAKAIKEAKAKEPEAKEAN